MTKINDNETSKDDFRTVFVMRMGKFINNDLAYSPSFQDEPKNCCDEFEAVDYKDCVSHNERCFPIFIPEGIIF